MTKQLNTFSSGNQIVDQMYGIEITGNVIPLNWFKTITKPNGKPNSIAIMLLSDFVYWYRPRIVRDEFTGEFTGIEKRFKADLLQRSYKQLSEQFGYSKRQVTEAVKELESLGVIRRVFRNISTNIQNLNNVLYIQLFPEKLIELTYPEKDRYNISHLDVTPLPLKSERVSQSVAGDITIDCHTNTEITTENTTIDHPLISISDMSNAFKDQIEYDAIVCDLPLKKPMLDEIVSIAAEVLTSCRKTIRVNKEERPVEQVQERFYSLNIEHIKYVLASFDSNMSAVKNIRAFLITSLYNAPATIDSYYTAKVNHDLACERRQ